MKLPGLLSDVEYRSLMQEMREASLLMREELIRRNGQVLESDGINQLSEWAEIERVAQICLGNAAAAWLEKPLKNLGGQSVRQAFDSGQGKAVIELMQQIMSGYVF